MSIISKVLGWEECKLIQLDAVFGSLDAVYRGDTGAGVASPMVVWESAARYIHKMSSLILTMTTLEPHIARAHSLLLDILQ